ncbi:MAG: hypothetical protein QW261_09015 [Candidatus Jordarchaeaceae archaeon]|nr:hypothetical protein [Candidatus Bathyarchaeota archaeon]
MPNGGSDCCGTCTFNRANKDKSQEPFCEVRNFKIEDPYWTYCNNHPRRNPLLVRTPRGPVWTAIFAELDSKPFSKELQIPPKLLPPKGDAMYVRAPFCGGIRPYQDGAGVCTICGEECMYTVSVEPLNQDKKFFCSTAHYFEWWFNSCSEATMYREETPINKDSFKKRLEEISKSLSDAEAELRTKGDKQRIVELLLKVDDLLFDLGYGGVDLIHAAIYTENPELNEGFSPFMLRLQIDLSRAGNLLQQDILDTESVLTCLYDIQDVLKKISGK